MKNFFVTYKNPVSLLLVIILLGGAFAYSKMQTALFPEITFPKIKIIADAGQQPVDKMMITVTRQLETAIKQIPELQTIRSTTSRGSCELSAFLNWNANVDLAQQRIQSKISEVSNTLPAGVNITVERMNPSILPVMGYSLESHSRSPIEMKMLAMYTIKPFLSRVQGVSEVRVTGGKTKEYDVLLNQQKMNALGITPDAVSNIISQNNSVQSNGYLNDYRQMYLTITDASVTSLSQLQNIVVSNDNKRIVLLKDIADVSINDAKEYIKINANGHEGLLLAIIKQPAANLIDVSTQMEKQVAALQKILPKDVTIKPYYIQADFVNDAIKSVTDSLGIGLALAIVVAVIFLRSAKASSVILVTVPVTLFLTLIVLYATGQTLNIMTLGAIAASLGLIIDDAIVVVEQIHRTHEEHPGESSTTLVQKAIAYLFPAMVSSSLSTIVIFLPFKLMSGIAGAYFGVLTDTMLIVLICSFFVTWLGLPVVYLLFSGNKPGKQKEEKPHSVHSRKWVEFFIKKAYISIVFVIGLIVAIVLIYPNLETGFLPDMDEGSIILDYASPPGTSLAETDRMLQAIEKEIVKVPDVQAYSRRTGTQMGFFITEPNTGDYLIQLKRNHSRSTDEVIADIRQRVESTQPALRVDFGQVIGDMLGDLMTSVQPIEIKIFGNDEATLHTLSKQVADIVTNVKGTADVFDGITITGPTISVLPNYLNLAQYGITPSVFQSQLQTALEGNVAGSVYDKDQLTDVRILYANNRTLTLDQMKAAQIFLPNGQLKSIASLANIQVTAGEAEIQREDMQNMGVVEARLDNTDLGTAIENIQQQVSKKVALPQGYSIEYGGSYADQQQSFHELLIILVTSSLLVFGVILFMFRDYRIAFLILLIAVLGISGSFLGLYLTNTPLNVGSYTGLIMIVGIIGENAIFTFLQYKERVQETDDTDGSVIYAISTRLRPKLMTAIGAIIALMPIALGIGTGAQLHQPLAIAVIGGFVIALPLLLIVLPTGIRLLYKKQVANSNSGQRR